MFSNARQLTETKKPRPSERGFTKLSDELFAEKMLDYHLIEVLIVTISDQLAGRLLIK